MKTEPITEPEPTKYRYYQNKTIIAGFKRKKEIQRAFDAYLNDSCGEYQTTLAKEIVK
jgi:hypothetical protein